MHASAELWLKVFLLLLIAAPQFQPKQFAAYSRGCLRSTTDRGKEAAHGNVGFLA